MDYSEWTRQVFRLRKLPSRVRAPSEAAVLLEGALSTAPGSVVVYSVAETADRWESPKTKVATLQFTAVPSSLNGSLKAKEWEIPSVDAPGGVLILDTHFEGMTVLHDADLGTHHTDLIAISGLASHPFGSWQPRGHNKTFMWIRDELPRSIPGVRTIIYGYDSQLLGSQSFQTIGDISLGLLPQLHAGGWSLTTSKPIIFLAHSLGGIVLKDAIVLMADRENFSPILNNIKGIMMFGVPSLGMHQSHLQAMVEGQANETLVQDLSRENGSSYLRQLNKAFDGLSFLKTTCIYWAYETQETPTAVLQNDGSWSRNGTPAVLVNPDSATCHNNTKNKLSTIPINKNHSNMVKFSRGDKDLGSILSYVSELSAKNRSSGSPLTLDLPGITQDNATEANTGLGRIKTLTEDQETLQDMCKTFSSVEGFYLEVHSPELDFRVNQIEDPFQNTFSWIFDLPLFYNWIQEGSGLFWISGKPGSGKSTLMKYIYRSQQTWELMHDWRRASNAIEEVATGFFFHYRGTTLQKSFEGVLRSLIIQILAPYYEKFQPLWKRTRIFEQEWLELVKRKETLEEKETEIRNQIDKSIGESKVVTSRIPVESTTSTGSTEESPDQQLTTIQTSLKSLEAEFLAAKEKLPSLIEELKTSKSTPGTSFFLGAIEEFHQCGDGLITKLERTLHNLLDHEIIQMDMIIFLDALDEFAGHADVICRFLKGLTQNVPTRRSRIKICFSSRPSDIFQSHFSGLPGFRLHEQTRSDIEEYATSKLANSPVASPSIIKLIISRAQGVFLWVSLAVKELLDTISSSETDVSTKSLEKRLLQLPDDLFDFYELIIERISKPNRRYTYALLELIIRQRDPPASISYIHWAVLFSGFSSQDELSYTLLASLHNGERDAQNDFVTWSGGLVEIKGECPQLMHQTVLEFVMGLGFKTIVLGDIATIVVENGHSFHAKYLALMSASRELDVSEQHRKEFLYHATRSELTTGNSQLEFFDTIPQHQWQSLKELSVSNYHEFESAESNLLLLVMSSGLALCLRDWLVEHSLRMRRLQATNQMPLLRQIFKPHDGMMSESYLTIVRLLLGNGYDLNKDPGFFNRILTQLWTVEMREDKSRVYFSESALYTLFRLALEHGQDINASISVSEAVEDVRSGKPLHMATISVASELIEHGADPNVTDALSRTPMDWVVNPPYNLSNFKSREWILEYRFRMCGILLKAGGLPKQSDSSWANLMDDFEKGGHDTTSLREQYKHLSERLRPRENSDVSGPGPNNDGRTTSMDYPGPRASSPANMSMSIEDAAKTRPGFPRPFPNTPNNVLEQLSLKGKVIVVTGAADGIGLAVAEAMAEAGGHVALWFNSNDAAIFRAKELANAHGIKSIAFKVDVSNTEQIESGLAAVVKEFGKIDVFVANAGLALCKPILEQTLDEYRKQMSVNVDGVVYCSKSVGAIFKQQGFGNLIITSSMSAHIVNVPVDQPVYNATKAFVTHFGKCLAREWRDFARVNIVSPGFFDTKMGAGPEGLQEAYRMSTLGRQGHVKEIKGLYLYLASDASTYMTGSDVLIDGGYVLP
ncbi:unnamed protein product [Clonostachys byssicola]|uniref:Nephrocystin 3-like N-terminal domain-containing protein n=1 Tax=Clonostachys byssicola TaxID=160290 RepID=A0A9N9UKH6_9HYPO|nr:unnamed protein product [Clonostachys byssicola]